MSLVRSYKQHRTGITRAMYASLLASFGIRLYRNMRPSATEEPGKVAINFHFIKNLLKLLRIAFPKLVSKDSLLVVAQGLLLVTRTYLSLYVARLDGRVTAALVQGKGKRFLVTIAYWMLIGVPASAANAAILYIQRLLSLRIRTQLTDYAVNKYMDSGKSQPVYYSIQQEQAKEVSVMNVGQLIAADTAKFASSLARLYSNLAKPCLDVVVYTWQLSQSIGGDNVFLLALAIQLSARALRLAAPPFGEFVATEAEFEGDFRSRHSRLIENAEEVAFYNGYLPEKMSLDRSFYSLTEHIDRSLRHRLAYSSLEDFVVKYWWGAAGLVSCSVPAFSNKIGANRAQNFVVNRKLLLLSSDAVGRIMASYKDISSLAGLTARVSDFLSVIDGLSTAPAQLGNVIIDDYVEFKNVSVISPSNETLISNLNFRINQGEHLLIIGPNGSGKSSLFRVLGGLWPVNGQIVRPEHNNVFYIPQRPYLSRGTLRQQIIYPQTEEENQMPDQELLKILEILGIDSLVESVGGFDTVREWRDDLSIGAQQKIAAARLFYHRPKFAILDECTASVTLDTETTIYTHAQKLGITLLTVSHRASLWQYHNKILQLDGHGGYLFTDLNPSERLALEEEKLKIDHKLRHIEAAHERLAVLKQERQRLMLQKIQEET